MWTTAAQNAERAAFSLQAMASTSQPCGRPQPFQSRACWSAGRRCGLAPRRPHAHRGSDWAGRPQALASEGEPGPVRASSLLRPLPQQQATPSQAPQRTMNLAPIKPAQAPQKPAWISAPIIMRRILAARSWEELQRVVDQYEQQLNTIHMCAAVVHLARLQQAAVGSPGRAPRAAPASRLPVPPTQAHTSALLNPRPAYDLLRRLLSRLLDDVDHVDVRGVANVLHALACLRHHDAPLVSRLLAAVQYRLDLGTPQNLSNIMWACVSLGYDPEPEWIQRFYDAVDVHINRFGPQDISNTLWAFGRLQFNGTQYRVAADIIRKLLLAALPQLGGFTPQQLSNVAWGLARLGFAPSPAWAAAFLAATQPRLRQMLPAELCALLWGVFRGRMQPPRTWLVAAVQVSDQWLGTLTSEQLSLLLVSLGGLDARPPARWLEAAMAHSSARAAGATPRALAATMSGMSALLRRRPDAVPHAAADAWLQSHLAVAWRRLGDIGLHHTHQDGTPSAGHGQASGNGVAVIAPCSFSALELAHVLVALAGLRVALPYGQLQHVSAALLWSPGLLEAAAADGRVMALLAPALRALHDRCIPVVQPGGGPGTPPCVGLARPDPPGAQRVRLPAALLHRIAELSASRLRRTYGGPQLAALLGVFAAQRMQPPPRWLAYFWWRSLVLLGAQRVSPAATVSLLRSLAALRLAPHAAWWRGLEKNALRSFPAYTPGQFGQLVARMAVMRYVPGRRWVRRLLLATFSRPMTFRPGDWARLLWGLARFKANVPGPWMRHFFARSQDKLGGYRHAALAKVGWAAAKLRTRPPTGWGAAYQAASLPCLAAMSRSHLLRCVTAVSHITRRPDPAWVAAAVSAARRHSGSWSAAQELALALALQRLKRRLQALSDGDARSPHPLVVATTRHSAPPRGVRLRRRAAHGATGVNGATGYRSVVRPDQVESTHHVLLSQPAAEDAQQQELEAAARLPQVVAAGMRAGNG